MSEMCSDNQFGLAAYFKLTRLVALFVLTAMTVGLC